MNTKINIRKLLLSLLLLILSGCGGGGGGGGTSTGGSADGFWMGSTNNGYSVAMLVTPDSTTWGFYYFGNTIYGAFNGNLNGSGSSLSGSLSEFNFSTQTGSSSTLSGSVVAGSSISMADTSGLTFSGAYNSSYTTPASLATITGNFTGWALSKGTSAATYTISIASSGQITSSTVNGCSVSGNITPAAGYGYYSLAITTSGSCALGNGTAVNGIAVYDAASSRLYAIGLNGSKSDGFFFSGQFTGAQGSATTTFPARQAWQNYFSSSPSGKFNVTGSCNGTFSFSFGSPVSATFNSISGYSVAQTTTEQLTNCTPTSISAVDVRYLDSNYNPLGFNITSDTTTPLGSAYYGEYQSAVNIPATVSVGNTGSLGTLNLYTNSSKTTFVGTAIGTYAVSAETTTSVLLTLTDQRYDTSNNLLSTENDVYRLTSAGTAVLLNITITYSNGTVLYIQ